MNICFIGKHPLKPQLTDNRLDAPIFLHFAKTFDRVFLIFESADGKDHHTVHGNVELFLIGGTHGLIGLARFPMRAFWLGRMLHRRHGIDVVTSSEPFGSGLAAILLRRLEGIPFMFQIQGQLLNLPAGSYIPLRRWVTRQVTRIVAVNAQIIRCVSNDIRDTAIRSGISERKLRFLGCRIDFERFNHAESGEARENLRTKMGLCPDDFALLFVGALLRDKGVYELVKALELIVSAHPGARLVFVGRGPERAGLEQAVASLGMADKVIFVGAVDHDEVPGYMAAADVFVLSSRHEGWGRVIAEAMAMALPTVASNVGGISDVLIDGETGLLLQSNSAEEMCEAVGRLIDDPALRRRLGERGLEVAKREWPFKKQADELVRLHMNVMKDHNQPMNICFIGKHPLRPQLTDNRLDAPIFLHFAKTFDRVFLIFESADGKDHHTVHGNVELFLIGGTHGLIGLARFPMRAFWLGRMLHRRHGIDVVTSSEPFGSGLAAILLRRLEGIPFMFQIQGQLLNLPAGSYIPLRRWVTRQVTRIVAVNAQIIRCVSNDIRDTAIRSGISERKLRFLGCRIDFERFNHAESGEARENLRTKMGLCPDDFALLFVGALLRDKGVYELVKALELIVSAHPGARLVFVGRGPERAGLEQAVASLGMADKVIFVGAVDHDEVPGYMAAADVFVLSSRHEGWGRVIAEAMAMALPTVASNVGGISDVLIDGETGLLLQSNSAEEMCEAVGRLIDDPALRRRLGERGLEVAKREWPFKKQADELVRLHVELVWEASR